MGSIECRLSPGMVPNACPLSCSSKTTTRASRMTSRLAGLHFFNFLGAAASSCRSVYQVKGPEAEPLASWEISLKQGLQKTLLTRTITSHSYVHRKERNSAPISITSNKRTLSTSLCSLNHSSPKAGGLESLGGRPKQDAWLSPCCSLSFRTACPTEGKLPVSRW